MHTDQTVTIFKALADPTRLNIVRTLAHEKGDASCTKVSACADLSQPAMSHHFGKLVEAGILVERKEGKQKFYELDTDLLQRSGIDISKL